MTTFDQKIAEYFNSLSTNGWNWGNLILCFIALLLSFLLCGLIGFEREKKARNAGLRTHLLVGMGSCVIMIISIYGFPKNSVFDVSRLAAGVVTGVGFLGAGAIIHKESGIKGLTTASTIWLSMAIGLACGSMNFILALACTIIVIIVLVTFKKVERHIAIYHPLITFICGFGTKSEEVLKEVGESFNVEITEIRTQIMSEGESHYLETTFVLSLTKENVNVLTDFMAELEKKTDAKYIKILNAH